MGAPKGERREIIFSPAKWAELDFPRIAPRSLTRRERSGKAPFYRRHHSRPGAIRKSREPNSMLRPPYQNFRSAGCPGSRVFRGQGANFRPQMDDESSRLKWMPHSPQRSQRMLSALAPSGSEPAQMTDRAHSAPDEGRILNSTALTSSSVAATFSPHSFSGEAARGAGSPERSGASPRTSPGGSSGASNFSAPWS